MRYKDIEEAARYKNDIAKIDGMLLMEEEGWDCAPASDLMERAADAVMQMRNNTHKAKDGGLATVSICGVTLYHWELQRLLTALADVFSGIAGDREDALRRMLSQEPEGEWKEEETDD